MRRAPTRQTGGMGKELTIILAVLVGLALLFLTPARQWLPDGMEQGIERLIRGASVNVQGPTVQYP